MNSTGGGPSHDGDDSFSRAASLRLEAIALRERARGTDEIVIRNEYFKLADRWTVLAAALEAQLLAKLVDAP